MIRLQVDHSLNTFLYQCCFCNVCLLIFSAFMSRQTALIEKSDVVWCFIRSNRPIYGQIQTRCENRLSCGNRPTSRNRPSYESYIYTEQQKKREFSKIDFFKTKQFYHYNRLNSVTSDTSPLRKGVINQP